jgi:hypothetical protein
MLQRPCAGMVNLEQVGHQFWQAPAGVGSDSGGGTG